MDFNIEATDNVDSVEPPVSNFLDEPYPLEAPSEIEPKTSEIVKQTDCVKETHESAAAAAAPPVTPSVNGNVFITPPTVKKPKRPYNRRSGSKSGEKGAGPVVKLTKLSPKTLSRHTNGVSQPEEETALIATATPVVNEFVHSSPPPPPRPHQIPPQMQDPPEEEPQAPVVQEEPLPSVSQPQSSQPPAVAPSKNGRARFGPTLLKRNTSMKKVVMPKGIPRSKAKAAAALKADAKAAAANGESGIRPFADKEPEPCVECVKCAAVIKVSSARDHLTACPGQPPIPTPVNDENDQCKSSHYLDPFIFKLSNLTSFL